MTAPHPVHTVLLDADGVLQWPEPGWLEVWRPHAGDDLRGFLAGLFEAEKPALRGEAPLHACIAAFLRAWWDREPTDAEVEDVASAWSMIEVFDEAFALVDDVRALGVHCHLATNQQVYRRDIMLGLGYPEHFDRLFFSCDLGVAKPDPAYFEAILGTLGHGPEGVVFVDDRPDNVEAARSVGLTAYVHDTHTSADQGLSDLREILHRAGVTGLSAVRRPDPGDARAEG